MFIASYEMKERMKKLNVLLCMLVFSGFQCTHW